jgi:hypothetical protein
MNSFELALQTDVEGRLVDAIRLYEACLAAAPPPALEQQALIHLLVMYWFCTFDYGMSTECRHLGVSEAELLQMYHRYQEILSVLQERYSADYESTFWSHYIAEEDSAGAVSAQTAIAALVEVQPDVNLGYLYLAMNGLKYPFYRLITPLLNLYGEVYCEGLTFKNRWIADKIGSVFRFQQPE